MAHSNQKNPYPLHHHTTMALEKCRETFLHYGYAYVALKSKYKRIVLTWLQALGTSKKTYIS